MAFTLQLAQGTIEQMVEDVVYLSLASVEGGYSIKYSFISPDQQKKKKEGFLGVIYQTEEQGQENIRRFISEGSKGPLVPYFFLSLDDGSAKIKHNTLIAQSERSNHTLSYYRTAPALAYNKGSVTPSMLARFLEYLNSFKTIDTLDFTISSFGSWVTDGDEERYLSEHPHFNYPQYLSIGHCKIGGPHFFLTNTRVIAAGAQAELMFNKNASLRFSRIETNEDMQTIPGDWNGYKKDLARLRHHAHACCARNRFLQYYAPKVLEEALDSPSCDQLWTDAQEAMITLFERHAPEEIMQNDSLYNAMSQLSSLGFKQLDKIFEILKEKQSQGQLPRLPIFHLSHFENDLKFKENVDRESCYAALLTLAEKYPSLTQELHFCFSSDDDVSDDDCEAFLRFVNEINSKDIASGNYGHRTLNFYAAVSPVKQQRLLCALRDRPGQDPLLFNVRFPQWDNTIFDAQEDQHVNAAYHDLQNMIAQNRRVHQYVICDNANQSAASAGTAFNVNVHVKLPQNFRKPITVSAQSAAYELTMQQEHQQEQQAQEQQQEQEEQREGAENYEQYNDDVDQLISRDSLETEEEGLIFTRLVGHLHHSGVDFTIHKIEPEAWAYVKAHARTFGCGLGVKLPDGFSLRHLPDQPNAYVLCFSEELRLEQARAPLSTFQPDLRPLRQPDYFDGDVRQLAAWPDLPQEQYNTVLAYFRKPRINDDTFVNFVHEKINAEANDSSASILVACRDAQWPITAPESFERCRGYLTDWALKNGVSPDIAASLFHSLTEANVKALGQLFYQYQCAPENGCSSAMYTWLAMMVNAYQTFKPEYIECWKRCVLDESSHWGECFIEPAGFKALNDSMTHLKNHEKLQEVWFDLMLRHHEDTGPMRYAPLWTDYAELMRLVQVYGLTLKPDLLQTLIRTYPKPLNGQVLLGHICGALKRAGAHPHAKAVQQHILDNLHRIDWRDSAFPLASKREGHWNWSEEAELGLLDNSAISHLVPNDRYVVRDAVRFLNRKVYPSPSELNKYTIILESLWDKTHSKEVLNTFLISVAFGRDNSQTWGGMLQAASFEPPVWLNRLFPLDGPIQRNAIPFSICLLTKINAKIAEHLTSENVTTVFKTLAHVQRFIPDDLAEVDKEEIVTYVIQEAGKDLVLNELIYTYPWLLSKEIFRSKLDQLRALSDSDKPEIKQQLNHFIIHLKHISPDGARPEVDLIITTLRSNKR